MNRTVVIAFTLAAAFFACRDDGGPGGDDTTGGDAPAAEQTIQEVQSMNMMAGTKVTLRGVIVTAIDMYGGKTGDIWVQEPGGGEFSGVHVFGAPLSQVGALALGDVVDIEGAEKDEFAYQGSNGSGGDTSGRSVTELKPVSGGMMSVTKTGSGTLPAPTIVDALAIGQKATQTERDAEWEKWEGVYVKVTNVTALNKPACVGSACNDDTLNKFDIVGQAVVESALAPFPGVTATNKLGTLAASDCLGGITGVVDYFFDYLLLNTEIMTGGTGCPVAESAATCQDGIDNDGNGFKDCDDNSCIPAAAACRAVKTIAEVQATTPMGGVELQDVFVTAVAFNKKDFWVSSALAASSNGGIYVRSQSGAANLDATVVVGAKVSVIGKVTEGNNDMMGDTLTQISRIGVTVTAAPTTPPVPVVGQTVDQLLMNASGEPYESVLVTLTNVKVTAVGNMANFNISDLSQKTTLQTTFKADDDVYRFVTADLNKCYSTITGIWTYSVFDNKYEFFPRATAISGTTVDGVVAANQADCN